MKQRYHVYYGYVSPDNYDASERPCYKMRSFDSEEDAIEFYEEFRDNINDECSNVEFRILVGDELLIRAKEVAIKHELIKSNN